MTDPTSATEPTTTRTTCVIAGGGPAGLVLGLLLARSGVEVTVLEKHADFLRDFRGDTVHPTTMGLLDDLGLFERFNELPQSRISHVKLPGPDGEDVLMADFTRLRLRHPYIAMVPQWDLLNLLAEAAAKEPTFTVLTEHEVTGVVRDGGRVAGVEYTSPTGSGQVLADLTVACDGRWSVVRRALDLPVKEYPVGIDVWWYRVPTERKVQESLLPRTHEGRVAIAIPREGYLQVAQLGRKGTDDQVRARGIEAFREDAAELLPDLADDMSGIESMDDVKHLDVRIDRLTRWHADGALCIGDAAHAMSPVGGVGINLAVQDAVAAAKILAGAAQPWRGPRGGRGSGAGAGPATTVHAHCDDPGNPAGHARQAHRAGPRGQGHRGLSAPDQHHPAVPVPHGRPRLHRRRRAAPREGPRLGTPPPTRKQPWSGFADSLLSSRARPRRAPGAVPPARGRRGSGRARGLLPGNGDDTAGWTSWDLMAGPLPHVAKPPQSSQDADRLAMTGDGHEHLADGCPTIDSRCSSHQM